MNKAIIQGKCARCKRARRWVEGLRIYSSSSSSSAPAWTVTHNQLLLHDISWGCRTHSVAGLLALIALFVRLGLPLVRLTLFGVECLPSLSEDLADLAYIHACMSAAARAQGNMGDVPKLMPGFSSLTFSRCSLAKNM